MTKKKTPETPKPRRKPQRLTEQVVTSATPSLTNKQRREVMAVNRESLLADSRRGAFLASLYDNALNLDGSVSNAVQTKSIDLLAAHLLGKQGDEAVNEIKAPAGGITITFNGRDYDPVTGALGMAQHEKLGMTKREYVEAKIAGTLPNGNDGPNEPPSEPEPEVVV